jgi:hypothetical protein
MVKAKKKKQGHERGPVVQHDLSDSSFRKALTKGAETSSMPSAGGRVIREMASDGNCLFRALSDQLHRDWGEGHGQVRQQVCSFLEKHAEEFAHFLLMDDQDTDSPKRRPCRTSKAHDDDKDVCDTQDYVQKMRHDGMWGGQVELVCAARLYRCVPYSYLMTWQFFLTFWTLTLSQTKNYSLLARRRIHY